MRRSRKASSRVSRAACLAIVSASFVACPQAPPVNPVEAGTNPFVGRPLYMNPWSRARNQAEQWRQSSPVEARLMDELGKQPVSSWFGDWTPDITQAIREDLAHAREQAALTLMVLYNIPNRDCGQYAAGGVGDANAYRNWIRNAKRGLGNAPAAVILEPDALGQLEDCLSADGQEERLALIGEGVNTLAEGGQTFVYIDAGNSAWHPPEVMADRLKRAGVAGARGFALNVSSYMATDESVKYGLDISDLLGGKPFIIDTSRNGNGPTKEFQWCNPRDRAVGLPPLSPTADPRVDAYVWVKVPGESDGECGGGPRAGDWWPEIAVELAKNADWVQREAGTSLPKAQPPKEPESSVAPAPAPRQ